MLTEDSFIDFKCPYCREAISFPRGQAGSAQPCPTCNETVLVPEDGGGEGRKLPLPLSTARLILRRFTGADWKDLLECLSDEELFRYVDGGPLQEDDVLRWLEQDHLVKLTSPERPFYLGIEAPEQDKLLGYLSLSFSDAHRLQAALNLCLNRNFQRQGFGLEAVSAGLGFCFEGIRLHRVTAWCDNRNIAAVRLFEKAGLRREGELVKNKLFNGEWASTVCFAMLDEEYRKTAQG